MKKVLIAITSEDPLIRLEGTWCIEPCSHNDHVC